MEWPSLTVIAAPLLLVVTGPWVVEVQALVALLLCSNPGRGLDPDASQRLQEQAAQNLLRRELPPDAFVALASRLERPYMQSASLRVAEPRQMVAPSTSSVPQDVEADSSGSRAPHPNPGEGLAVRQRTWPAGANPGALYASASVACSAPAADSDIVGVGGASSFASTGSTGTVATCPRDVMIIDGEAYLRPRPKRRPRVPNPSSVVDLTDVEAPPGITEQPAVALLAYSLLPGRLGECLGPVRLSYCQERQDYEIRWNTSEALAVHGRPLHSDRTTRLFLGDVDLAYLGPPDDTRAPATPPTIMESMRHRARLQDQAGAALRLAAASGSSGDGTPPLAFTPDGDVSDFMARYLYKGAQGDSAPFSSLGRFGVPPVWLLRGSSLPHILPADPLLWVPDLGQSIVVPAFSYPRIHSFPWLPELVHPLPPPLMSTQLTPGLCHRSVAAASLRLLERRCCRLVPSLSVTAPPRLWAPRATCRAVHWYVPLLLRCQWFQLHPWSRARRSPTRCGRRIRRWGRSRIADVLCRCGCSLFLQHKWPAVIRCVPSRLWAHVAFPNYALLQLFGDLLLEISYPLPGLSFPLVALMSRVHWSRPALLRQHTHSLPYPLGMPVKLGPPVTYSNSSHSLPHICGPPGPKSRDHSTLAGRWLHRLVLSFMITPSCAVIDARVPASARDAGGAASASGWHTHVAAKPSGRSEATRVSQPIDQNLRIRKRTFKRAVARAARTGGAYYKGRWRSAQQFGVPVAASETLHATASTRPLRTPKHPSPDAPPLPKHLKILTWNAGGLGGQTGALLDELQVYANSRPFDILFVQESRWTFSNTWEDPRWFFVHSGSSERDFKQGGVLILVAKRIVDPGSLRFVEPLPGRILWVHFTYRGRPVDLLNFYQHTWRNSERVAQLRHRALDLLTKSIQTISLRSVLIAAGDFNAQCVQQMPHVAPKVMQHTHWAQDSGEFQSFIEGNDLVALNTFSSLPKSHDHFTYTPGAPKNPSWITFSYAVPTPPALPSKPACTTPSR